MDVLGIRSGGSQLRWAALRGDDRPTALLLDDGGLNVPSGSRGEELAWVRREVLELVEKFKPDLVALAPAEGSVANVALLERSQVDGVILEAAQRVGVQLQSPKSSTVRAAFGCKSNAELEPVLDALPCLSDIGRTSIRRPAIVVALTQLPS